MQYNESGGQAYTRILIVLLKGLVYQDSDTKIWHALLCLQARVRDYLALLRLKLWLEEEYRAKQVARRV